MDKIRWQLQADEEDAVISEHQRIQVETEDLRIQNESEEAETLRKDEMKKNKSKYLPHSGQGCTDSCTSICFQLRCQTDGKRSLC